MKVSPQELRTNPPRISSTQPDNFFLFDRGKSKTAAWSHGTATQFHGTAPQSRGTTMQTQETERERERQLKEREGKMMEDGNPKDNAQAERINNTMKNERLKGKSFCDIKEVAEAVEKTVLFYHTERPHMSINMMTPQEAATHTGEIKKGWTSYRDIAIKNLQTENIVSNKCLSLGA